jgi:hypothetical protein
LSSELDRQGTCPECGAQITFPFAGARAQVCQYCRFVVVRTDGGWSVTGKVADLLPLPTPIPLGATASLGERHFRVAGRAQYDRVGAASAPWQELFVEDLVGTANWAWLALAQGRWYWSALVSTSPLPSYEEAEPGRWLPIPNVGTFMVMERGARRLVSAEGELPFAANPGAIERYADLSGQGGAFATIDYGDGSEPPKFFSGMEGDPHQLRVEAGAPPAEAASAETRALVCAGCGGPLPLAAPDSAQRVICKYCGMQSDVTGGGLSPIGKVPLPKTRPEIPIGAEGDLRGQKVVCVGFMVRGTTVDGERYRWREYLLYAPATRSFVFLLEEDGDFEYIVPISGGEVASEGDARSYRGDHFAPQPSLIAQVEEVVGEFYWRVEQNETVTATEYRGRGGAKLSEEAAADEVDWSYSVPLPRSELTKAFGPTTPVSGAARTRRSARDWLKSAAILLGAWLLATMSSCASKHNQVVFTGSIPVPSNTAPSTADGSFFTPAFDIDRDKRSLEIELSALNLREGWIGADIALIRDDNGDVQEASTDLENFDGDGSQSDTVVFSRIDAGRYLVRVDPAGDANGAKERLAIRIVHDTWSPLYVFGSFGLLLAVFLFCTLREFRHA